ncbi:maleylacetoacetate isomerase [Paraburkholderia dipogonis]|uniref:Maleylacetoacetate isomerase n=1 Tax=Paraburkholderia dipogonis TaxID=1211383 RepID=A0A4Y8MHU9_9BURK|nr:maleylacetoacetate isomerase [Paraburkholderia dipogonis]TFE37011.1 maleylacetoacetate isomerase [Paraburkholderia dipogonis]
MTLYNYFRSSASYRVRIALELKGLKYDYVPIHLSRSGGEQFASNYAEVNPEKLVPTFVDAGGSVITQSLAIIEYVDETHPDPALLPQTPMDRAYVRSIANLIACDIHPVDNLRVLGYLKNVLNVTDEQKSAWYRHWVEEGFKALETHLVRESRPGGRVGTLCFGDKPTLADLCLVPQVFNARRMQVPLDNYPTIQRIVEAASAIPAFERASPGRQIDSE